MSEQHSHQHDMAGMEHGDMPGMEHDGMGHGSMPDMPHGDMPGMEHDGMGHGQMQGMEHGNTGHSQMPGMSHQNMNHGGMPGMDHGMHMDMGDLKRRFFVCLALGVPVVVLGYIQMARGGFGSGWLISSLVVLALSTVLYFYGGKPFLTGAAAELKSGKPAMMTLVSLGISVSYFYSVFTLILNLIKSMDPARPEPGTLDEMMHTMTGGGPSHDFFMELAMLIVIMLLGHWIEMRALSGAGSALEGMAALLPGSANVLAADGSVTALPLKQLQVGQTVLVAAGEKIPADGTVLSGAGGVNEAMVTGEAKQVPKAPGDKVIGGAVNGDASLTVRVTATGQSGYLAQVMELVGRAQKEKSRAETLSDKVAGWLFYAAVIAGALAFIVWWLAGSGVFYALSRTVTVLVIACPHALGLAIPLVVARSTSIGAKNGLLVRNRQALEAAQKVNVVAMDKTGTLTEGRFTLRKVKALSADYSDNDVLQMAAALEQGSSHPLAAGILAAAREHALSIAPARDIQNLPGAGLHGTLPGGQSALLASAAHLKSAGIPFDETPGNVLAEAGNAVSYLVVNGAAAGLLAQGDEIKPDADLLVDLLDDAGIAPVMLTGDNAASAAATAKKIRLKQVHAALLPQDKERLITQMQSAGKVVMMVGDGVNDAPSLARANIGAAIGAGTDVAIDSADVVLVRSDPLDILRFLELGSATTRKMKQNLFWGAGYNIVAIPLAAGILAPLGFVLGPAAGAVLMSLSTVIVAINALALRLPQTDAERREHASAAAAAEEDE